MKRNLGIIVLTGAYILMLPAMFIIPLFNGSVYSIIENTLSESGAQSQSYTWIMDFIFAALATGSVLAGWSYFEGYVAHRIVLVIFGVSLLLMALFNHAPVSSDIWYNIREAGWHSYFGVTAIISFLILSIATSFILGNQRDRVLAVAAGLSSIFLSILMSEADHSAGVWQRLMLIISFGWMIYNFRTREF